MIIHTVTLSCDVCLEEADPSFPTASEMRSWARMNGWKMGTGSGDRCPTCAQHAPRPQEAQ